MGNPTDVTGTLDTRDGGGGHKIHEISDLFDGPPPTVKDWETQAEDVAENIEPTRNDVVPGVEGQGETSGQSIDDRPQINPGEVTGTFHTTREGAEQEFKAEDLLPGAEETLDEAQAFAVHKQDPSVDSLSDEAPERASDEIEVTVIKPEYDADAEAEAVDAGKMTEEQWADGVVENNTVDGVLAELNDPSVIREDERAYYATVLHAAELRRADPRVTLLDHLDHIVDPSSEPPSGGADDDQVPSEEGEVGEQSEPESGEAGNEDALEQG
jgi:hypothetical protein